MPRARMNFARANLKKILTIPLFVFGWVCAWFVPRNTQRWIFGSGIGVGEGALAVAQALQARDLDAHITWVVGSPEEASTAQKLGFEVTHRNHPQSFWLTLRAGHIVVTHGHGDVNRFGIFRGEVTHLIHGAPLKRLHLDSTVTTRVAGPRLLALLLSKMYQAGSKNIQLFVAGSHTAAQRLRTAYQVLPGKVRVLGDPRDDIILEQKRDPQLAAEARLHLWQLLTQFDNGNDTQAPETLVLYAPTWRDGAPDPAIPTAAEITAIHQFCDDKNVTLLIRSHPLGAGSYTELLNERVRMCESSTVPDITQYLSAFDALITDYSSIAVDYSLLERPIIWFAPDLDTYSQTRGLYEPLEVTSVGKITRSWEAALQRISDTKEPGSVHRRVAIQDALHLQRRFHAFPHDVAAPRVLDAIQQLSRSDAELIDAHSVFFESFYGNNVACNPAALDHEIAQQHPTITRYWSVVSETVRVPTGAIPLLVGSREWFAARRVAPLLIVNDWLRFGFARGSHQTVLQTWHGTMLKQLALNRPNVGLRTRLAIRRESRRWSLLLSGNDHTTNEMRQSYAYAGEILELGYPRTDDLARSLAGHQRSPITVAAARRRLGIPEGASVLSYAPTWRDGVDGKVDLIDVQALVDELGPDWVVVARAHTRSHSANSYGLLTPRVIDASNYADINDIIIASDVFVTDYSSSMFDASVARVPTLFFVPDQTHYRDVARGFTFNFAADAPGPLCETREQICQFANEVRLQGSEAPWQLQYRDREDAFRARFAPRDDGFASHRVIAELDRRGLLPGA